jgi:hypothetical protein
MFSWGVRGGFGARGHAAPDVEIPVADSIYTAPGWRVIGDDHYTAVPPVDCPADPGVTRAIRQFWPDAVPIWRKQRYLPPGERSVEVVVSHHGIATYQAHPKAMRRLFHVEMPAGAKGPAPNQLEAIFEHPNYADIGGPGLFLPWDNRLYMCVRGNYRDDNTSTADVFERALTAQEERQKRERKARDDDFAYRRKHLEKRIAATLEALTERDFREYQARCRAPRERKVMVFQGQ